MKRYRSVDLKAIAIALVLSLMPACSYVEQFTRLQNQASAIPSVRVTREPIAAKVYSFGELRAARTATIAAPPVAGGALQIIRIVKTGTRVEEGEIVVEFDPSEQLYSMEQSQSQLEEADQQIKKMKADQAVRTAQDAVSLMAAEFGVRRAELTAKGNELLSGIEAKKNLISLEEAKRRLEQLQHDVESRASSDKADLAVQEATRTKAMMEMKLAQQNIDNMTLRAPIGGIVALSQNQDSMSGIVYSGMEIPEYREGDQVTPGRMIAQIQDFGEIEIRSKVTETERGGLDVGQQIDVQVDSKPLKRFSGSIKSLAPSAASSSLMSSMSSYQDYLEGLSTRSFDATFEIDPKGETLNAGVTARITIGTGQAEEVLSVPRQALFEKDGKQIVYIKQVSGWQAQTIQIKNLTESRAVVEGISEGVEVALVNPELQNGKVAGKANAITSILGGTSQ